MENLYFPFVKNPADPEKNKSRRESVVDRKVHFEARDALMALPITSTTGMVLLSPFQ